MWCSTVCSSQQPKQQNHKTSPPSTVDTMQSSRHHFHSSFPSDRTPSNIFCSPFYKKWNKPSRSKQTFISSSLPKLSAAPRSTFLLKERVLRLVTIFSVCVVCVFSTDVYSSSAASLLSWNLPLNVFSRCLSRSNSAKSLSVKELLPSTVG